MKTKVQISRRDVPHIDNTDVYKDNGSQSLE